MACRRVLVTGGCSGIGAAMVRRFVRDGAQVGTLDLACGDERVTDVDLVIGGDVAVHADVAEAFARVRDRWDGLDVLLNNAGVSLREKCLDVTPASWERVLGVNLTGAFFVAQAAARLMSETGTRGVIVNTASVSGLVGMPNYVSYNVSKAGLIAMTKTMALELAPRIRVNAICPGYVLTDMQRREYTDAEIAACAAGLPMARLGRPDEIAAMAAVLASDELEFATGQAFVVDGGETAGGLASR